MTLKIDQNIAPEFEEILDSDEILLWTDKPVFVPYILTFIWYNLFLLIYGLTILTVLIIYPDFGLDSKGNTNITLWITSIIFSCMGLWSIIKAIFSHGNTVYGYSAKRVLIRTGFIGTDFHSIDFDKIADIQVNVNIIERMYGVGSVRFSTGQKDSKDKLVYESFVSIKNPYAIFKLVKQTTMDIKTDIHYPNALRPEENPGYQTKYSRSEN